MTRLLVARRESSSAAQWDEYVVPQFAASVRDLRPFAAEHGVEPATVVCGAWALVLARYSGRPGPVFGTTTSGRSSAIPFSVDLAGSAPVLKWLQSLDRQRRAAPASAESTAGADGDPPFDTVLRFDDMPAGPPQHGMSLVATAHLGAEPRLSLAFDRSRLDGDIVEQLGRHLITVLDRLLRSPDRHPAEIPLLTEEEVARLATPTPAFRPSTRAFPEAVVAQATARPATLAVIAGEDRLTYADLVAQASRLAHHLRSVGVGPDTFVGIVLPRTTHLPVALLGVMLAGGAYVPIDPTYPEERVRFMLEDSGVTAVVTEGEWRFGTIPEGVSLVRLDADACLIAANEACPPDVVIHPESAAYVVYTSGSTGRPKGAVIEHRGLAAFVDWACRAFSDDERTLVAAGASISFDLSVYELHPTLAGGGTVLLLGNVLDLADRDDGVAPTTVSAVPSAMEALVRFGRVPRSARTLHLAGEALSRKLVDDLFATTEATRIVNVYGPSEATVCCTVACFERTTTSRPDGETMPIGPPIGDARLWILDDFGQPVPPGLPGELFIGGVGVGRGYRARPGLTAERYVPDPFSDEPGARLYRTGDIVRLRPDGQLEFVSRRDHQVKVRGFRIELLEIESQLLAHPAIREAVVVVTGERAADRALAAFVTVTGTSPGSGELERFLGDRLPAYMVPRPILVLDRLPRLPNGKADRAVLTTLAAESRAPSASAGRACRTTTEAALAEIWQEVLAVDDVGPDDDFFRLGGQSLLAVQVTARVHECFGVELRLPRLFELRTLSAMAAEIDATGRRTRHVGPIVRRGGRKGPVSVQQRAVLDNHDPTLVPTAPLVFRLSGDLDVRALDKALNELVRRHEVLRTVYRSLLRRHRQVVLPWSPSPLEVIDSRKAGPKQAVVDNIVSAFDLGTGPVIRWRLVRLGKQEHLLSISIHEIACDGWSIPVLLAELSTLYDDFVAGRPVSLPEPAIQYRDFALWQHGQVNRRLRRRQVDRWRSRLRDAPIALDLLPDRWPETFDTPVARAAEALVDAELCARLESLGRDEGATLFMVLAAALQGLLHRLTGSPRVVLRPILANRTNVQIEPVIGFFINHFLIEGDVSGHPPFRALLAQVRRELLDATQHADVPLTEVLQRIARMKTARAQWPAGPLRFQLFNFPDDRGLSLTGVRVVPEDPGIPMSDHFSLAGTPNPDGSLHLLLNYDGSLFGRARMERLLSRYCDVLGQVAASPDARVSSWALLDRRELEQVRRAGRGSPGAATPEPVHRLVREQAKRTPGAEAVASRAGTVTYGELVLRAGDVAARLRAAGVTAEAPVVLFASPGPAFAVGLLGVLEAGGMCVPVDTSLPADVVAAIVAHARPVAAVVDGSSAARLPVFGGPVVDVDGCRSPTPATETSVLLEQAAVALYSFGRGEPPRASVITHEALAHLAVWHRTAYKLRRTDRVVEMPWMRVGRLASALCSTLVAGATYLVTDGDPATGNWLVERATVCFGNGPLVKTCVSSPTPPRSPMRLFLSDEPVAAPGARSRLQVVEQWALPEAAGVWGIADRARTDGAPAFCGMPTGGAEAVLVDPSMNSVPPLEPGELLLRGPQVARGYFDDPRATALAFVPDPFADRPGARLFRTGLFARVDERHRIEVLGGEEGEWSARGMPMAVHLRRIEAALRAHPAVGSVVAKVGRALGEPRVFVFVVPCSFTKVGQRELRALLPKGLPPVAVPLSIKVLDKFPRRPDGRVDYGALQA